MGNPVTSTVEAPPRTAIVEVFRHKVRAAEPRNVDLNFLTPRLSSKSKLLNSLISEIAVHLVSEKNWFDFHLGMGSSSLFD
jgi:hypothetical protein